MKTKKSSVKTILVLLVLVFCAAGLLAGMIWFLNAHFFVGGKAYSYQLQELDLRDRSISVSEYEEICSQLPDSTIRWNVPFQGKAYPDDTKSLTVRSLSDADIQLLRYFPNLTAVDAKECKEYAQLQKLREAYPDIDLTYRVSIGGQEYAQDATSVVCHDLTEEEIALMAYLPRLQHVDASQCRDYERIGNLTKSHPEMNVSYQVELLGQTFTEKDTQATFQNFDVDALMEKLAWLPHMEKVHLAEPDASAETLLKLMDTYPNIAFSWDKTVLGQTLSSEQTEFDFSGMQLSSTDIIEEAMRYFPNAEKVIMSNCGIDNETMAAFREKMRPEYTVVWTVYVTKKPVRTDQEVIHSSAYKVCFIDEQSQDLKYCEGAVVVDIGHSYIKDISWVKGMPNLKYLVLTHNWVKDLTPISSCKNLVYLEIYWNDYIPDYTPLLECTSLVDLNASGTFANREPLKQMTWLKNLWINCMGVSAGEYQEFCEALPNTHIEYRGGDYTSYGWRDVQGYFDMRDFMGLPYNHW